MCSNATTKLVIWWVSCKLITTSNIKNKPNCLVTLTESFPPQVIKYFRLHGSVLAGLCNFFYGTFNDYTTIIWL